MKFGYRTGYDDGYKEGHAKGVAERLLTDAHDLGVINAYTSVVQKLKAVDSPDKLSEVTSELEDVLSKVSPER